MNHVVDKSIVCRVCLQSNAKSMKSLFENLNKLSICESIKMITQIEICLEDNLPDKICYYCLKDLETAIKFKEKCECSNTILLQNIKSDVKEETLKIETYSEPDQEYEYLEYLDSNRSQIKSETESYTFNASNSLPDQSLADIPEGNHLGSVQCDNCKQFFKSKCKLRVHWKKTHFLENLKCQFCKRTFKTYFSFNNHKRKKSKICRFSSEVHIVGEGKQRVYHCKWCSYKTIRNKDVLAHLVVHNGAKPYQCSICSSSYTQQSSLQSHLEVKHKLYKAQITCQYCGKDIKGKQAIYRHLSTHSAKLLQCDVCLKFYKGKYNLDVHKVRHTGIKKYVCEVCSAIFYTSSELTNHRRNVHFKLKKKIGCSICAYKSVIRMSVIKHESQHTSSNHPCVKCGKFFDDLKKLDRHVEQHSNKQFTCEYCFLGYALKKSLRSHIKMKHKEITIKKKEEIQIVN